MRIIAKRTLREFWERHPDARQPLQDWYETVGNADWAAPHQVKMAEITKVQTEAEYDAALARISELLDADIDTAEGRELDRLSDLVIEYEDEHYPIENPAPDALVEFLLDQEIVTREQLLPLAGSSADLDAILAGQKEVTPELAQLLCEHYDVTIAELLKEPAHSASSAASD